MTPVATNTCSPTGDMTSPVLLKHVGEAVAIRELINATLGATKVVTTTAYKCLQGHFQPATWLYCIILVLYTSQHYSVSVD